MTPLDKLVAHFEKFPGTGIRQAKRFAFHVLSLKPEQINELAHLITTLPQSVTTCTNCYRFFSENNTKLPQCAICRDGNRDRSKLLIVARDSDIESIERSGVYDGLYFVLGGTVSLLANPHDQQRIRSSALRATITALLATNTLHEIILAFAINPDGENTGRFIEATLKESLQNTTVTITHLGRGLSTGSELEYADPETIKNALASRG